MRFKSCFSSFSHYSRKKFEVWSVKFCRFAKGAFHSPFFNEIFVSVEICSKFLRKQNGHYIFQIIPSIFYVRFKSHFWTISQHSSKKIEAISFKNKNWKFTQFFYHAYPLLQKIQWWRRKQVGLLIRHFFTVSMSSQNRLADLLKIL